MYVCMYVCVYIYTYIYVCMYIKNIYRDTQALPPARKAASRQATARKHRGFPHEPRDAIQTLFSAHVVCASSEHFGAESTLSQSNPMPKGFRPTYNTLSAQHFLQ